MCKTVNIALNQHFNQVFKIRNAASVTHASRRNLCQWAGVFFQVFLFHPWSYMQLKKKKKRNGLLRRPFARDLAVLAGEDHSFPPGPGTAPPRGARNPADLPWARDGAPVPSIPGWKGPLRQADVFQGPVTRSGSVGTGTQHARLPAPFTRQAPSGPAAPASSPLAGRSALRPKALAALLATLPRGRTALAGQGCRGKSHKPGRSSQQKVLTSHGSGSFRGLLCPPGLDVPCKRHLAACGSCPASSAWQDVAGVYWLQRASGLRAHTLRSGAWDGGPHAVPPSSTGRRAVPAFWLL